MRIIIVGASGTLGKKITATLSAEHEIVTAGRKSGDLNVDISSTDSIQKFFEQAGKFDALISASGEAHYGPLTEMTDTDFRKGINSKLMGQINLVLIGQKYINPNGSFTITSGSLAIDPISGGVNISTVNAALDGFVMAAAVDLKNGVRINAVSPDVVEDSPQMFKMFPGHVPSKMTEVIAAYLKSVLGADTGKVIRVK